MKFLIVYFVLRWSTLEAVLHDCSIERGYMMQCNPRCSIETKSHEKKFDTEIKAEGAKASLETNGVKDAKIYLVDEEPL